jgi:GH24 family phage-related lysozyme (muramidase)
MMLTPLEIQELKAKKKQYEGYVTHMYLCTAGKVTIGMGHMMSSVAEAQKVRFLKADKTPASAEDIKNEFLRIQSIGKGLGASFYENMTQLHITDKEIHQLTDNHLRDFYTQLKRLYPEFDSYPKKVRFALFDMIYNLGAGGLRDKFPSFNRHVKNRNWAGAATESSRTKIAAERNQYVADLLNSEAGIDFSPLPSPQKSHEELTKPQEQANLPNSKPQPVKVNENQENISLLPSIYPKYTTFPYIVQLALIDMISTLGKQKLITQFPKFNKAVNSENWLRAAAECSRKNQKPSRNKNTANMFLAGLEQKKYTFIPHRSLNNIA